MDVMRFPFLWWKNKKGLAKKNTIVGKVRGKAATSLNEHIGSMAALPPLEKAVRKESFAPVRAAVEAPPAPSRRDVSRKRGTKI
jgi:hypothetical protein